jgi:uncharacterized protein
MAGTSLDPDDQSAVVAFLSDPASYDDRVDRVDRFSTHISLVFLAGERAYKLKRAVHYPYVHFSTAGKRHRACEAELALNRRTAPQLYLAVRGIGRRSDGKLDWIDHGDVLDWVVVMRRFDQADLFDALAEKDRLDPSLVRDLVDHIAQFHAAAKPRFDRGGAATVAAIEASNDECLRPFAGSLFNAADIARLHAQSRERLALVSDLLDRRRAAGKVRQCHGDLHLRNVCLVDGKPTLFDCIEFSEDLAVIDVLYDVAFLVMDLEHRGLRGLANLAVNRFFDLGEDDEALLLLPLFLSLRAAIRAHVTATAAEGAMQASKPTNEARRYLDLALAMLAAEPARLVALGGLSGVGKSTLARMLAPLLGIRPGARILRSDVIRKRLCGVSPETRLPEAAYSAEISRRVYEVVCRQAKSALRAGYCAVIDAVALTEDERRSFAAVAEEATVPFSGIWLTASPEVMTARLQGRRGDASDATVEVLRQQLAHDPGTMDWTRIEIAGDHDAGLAAVRGALGVAPR